MRGSLRGLGRDERIVCFDGIWTVCMALCRHYPFAVPIVQQIRVKSVFSEKLFDGSEPMRSPPPPDMRMADTSRDFPPHFARQNDKSRFVLTFDAETLNLHAAGMTGYADSVNSKNPTCALLPESRS